MASQIDLLGDLDSRAGKIHDDRPTDRIGIDCKLHASSRLRGEGKLSAIMERVRFGSFRASPFEDLDLQSPLHGSTQVGELHRQGEGIA